MMKKLFATFLLTCSGLAFAAISDYSSPELLARANISDGFNLPPMSYMSNTSPVINNKGDVVFKLMAFDGENNQGLWLKLNEEKNGKIVFTAPDMRFITDPFLNGDGKIIFNLYDEGITDGLLVLDTKSLQVEQVLKPEGLDIANYTYSQLLNNGKIYFRGTNEENERSFYVYDGALRKILSEGVSSHGQKSSYLFRPDVNELGEVAFKRRLGEKGAWDENNGDEILVLRPAVALPGTYDALVIVRDRDADAKSAYTSLSNSLTLSKHGQVAFTALLASGQRALVVFKEGSLRHLALEKEGGISEIELFTPKINEQGTVFFRAKDMDGKRGIYAADTGEVKKLIGEGDTVMTDLGQAKILSNPNYPGFSGEIHVNDKGELVFSCLLVSAQDDKEWGTAIYKLSPKK